MALSPRRGLLPTSMGTIPTWTRRARRMGERMGGGSLAEPIVEAGVHTPGLVRRHADRVLPVDELIVVQSGLLPIAEDRRRFAVRRGEWVLLRAGHRHFGHDDLDDDTWFYWVCFGGGSGDTVGSETAAVRGRRTGSIARAERVRMLFEHLLEDQEATILTPPAAGGYLRLLLAEILLERPAADRWNRRGSTRATSGGLHRRSPDGPRPEYRRDRPRARLQRRLPRACVPYGLRRDSHGPHPPAAGRASAHALPLHRPVDRARSSRGRVPRRALLPTDLQTEGRSHPGPIPAPPPVRASPTLGLEGYEGCRIDSSRNRRRLRRRRPEAETSTARDRGTRDLQRSVSFPPGMDEVSRRQGIDAGNAAADAMIAARANDGRFGPSQWVLELEPRALAPAGAERGVAARPDSVGRATSSRSCCRARRSSAADGPQAL